MRELIIKTDSVRRELKRERNRVFGFDSAKGNRRPTTADLVRVNPRSASTYGVFSRASEIGPEERPEHVCSNMRVKNDTVVIMVLYDYIIPSKITCIIYIFEIAHPLIHYYVCICV